MSDIHNAAVLLMSLPEEDASTILSKLEPKQVEQVSIEIARMRTISAEEQEKVIHQFAQTSPSAGGSGGGLEAAKSLLQKALGSNASEALANVRQSIEAVPFGFLRHVDRQNILTYIIDEHPQTIALIMSHLPPALVPRSSPDCPPNGSSPSSAASPRWARPIPKSSAKSKRASSAACRA